MISRKRLATADSLLTVPQPEYDEYGESDEVELAAELAVNRSHSCLTIKIVDGES